MIHWIAIGSISSGVYFISVARYQCRPRAQRCADPWIGDARWLAMVLCGAAPRAHRLRGRHALSWPGNVAADLHDRGSSGELSRLARVDVAYFGGKRWWFLCPMVRRDGKPPRRVAKLHLPRGARYFGSRRAYDLTYTSCRESGQFRRLYNSIAAEVGSTPEAVRAALKRKFA